MQKRLISLIHEAKPQRALFTTFTFSISWFEAAILPALRAAGCEHIDVLVDARGACASTDEAMSLYAGSAYRVIPVYMPGRAVFHPKLSYFQTSQNDCLVVSSANLTLAGHGKNLEVLDAVDSQQHPSVFGEFADFLEQLMSLHTFSDENLEVLSAYQVRAASVAETDKSPEQTAWMVHTLERSAASQFIELAQALPDAKTLTVLSPYHSPSGAPVQRLADALGVSELRIGLSASSKVAPFRETGQSFKNQPSYVVPKTDNPLRFLHAKTFEVAGSGGVMLMTGSVNATNQSLESLKNVEVSIVRKLKASPFEWTEVDAPEAFVPCDFSASEMTAQLPSLQANLTSDNQLRGYVEPYYSAELTVNAEVWASDTCCARVESVQVTGGNFSFRIGSSVTAAGGMRLILLSPELRAEGWINVEVKLAADEFQRSLALASSRILAGEYHISDLSTILGWLDRLQVEHTQVIPPTRTSPVSGTGSKLAVEMPVVSYAEWFSGVEHYRGMGLPATVARSSVEALFHWLNGDLLASKPSSEPILNTETPPSEISSTTFISESPTLSIRTPKSRFRLLATVKSEFSDSPQDEEPDENADWIVQQFLDKLPRVLLLDSVSPIVPAMVEFCGSACLKSALRQSDGLALDAPSASTIRNPLETWIYRFAAFDYSPNNREKLLPFFSAFACCAAYIFASTSLPAIKEALGKLAGRTLTPQEVRTAAELALGTNRFARILSIDHQAILNCSQAIGDSVTLSEQLEALIAQTITAPIFDTTRIPPELKASMSALRNHRSSAEKAFGVIPERFSDARVSCPCCHVALHIDDQTKLRTSRWFICKNAYCQRPLFYGVRREELGRLGLEGRFKG